MTLLVDTSVWSLALRRNAGPDPAALPRPQIAALRGALEGDEMIVTTGMESRVAFTRRQNQHSPSEAGASGRPHQEDSAAPVGQRIRDE